MRRLPYHLTLLSGFVLLTLVLTYPLATQFATHVPGSNLWAFDEYTFVWNLWWFRQALLHLQQSPLITNFIFYPIGIDLTLYTFTWFNAAAGLPLTAFLPLPLVSNLLTIFAFVLSGYGAYLLARWLWRATPGPAGELAAFATGIAYAFTTSKFMSVAIGHYNFAGTEWIPFCLLYFLRAMHSAARRDALICGLFLALSMYVEMNFGVFLVLFMVLYWLAERPWHRLGWSLALRQGFFIVAVSAAVFMPLLLPLARAFATADYALKGWGDALKLSVDLMGFVSPSAISSWAGLDWAKEQTDVIRGVGRFADVNTVFLGYATLSAAFAGWVVARKEARVWGIAAVVCAVLALGPLLQIYGTNTVDLDGLKVNGPLPFVLLHYIPVLQANRVPNRFSVLLTLCLAVLVGYLILWIWQRTIIRTVHPAFSWGASALVCVLIVFDHLAVPLPLTDARVPAFYELLARDEEEYTILQLPLGWRNSFGTLGAEDTRVQYYQTVHEKPILGGNTSRSHPFKFEYFRSLPIVSSLLLIEDYKPVPKDQRDFDRAFADEFVRFFDIRYVTVHPAVAGRRPYDDTRDAALSYLKDVLTLEGVSDSGDLLVYRVRRTAAAAGAVIDFGEPSSRLNRAEGWDAEEEIAGRRANWAIGPSARLLVRVPEPRDFVIRFAVMPFAYPGAPAQAVTAVVNGATTLPSITLASGWQEQQWTVPAAALRTGMNEVRLDFANARSPKEALGADDSRLLAAAFDWMEWLAK